MGVGVRHEAVFFHDSEDVTTWMISNASAGREKHHAFGKRDESRRALEQHGLLVVSAGY